MWTWEIIKASWPIIWHYGAAGTLTIGLLAAAYFFRSKLALALAGAVMLTTISYTVGVKNEHDRLQSIHREALRVEFEKGEEAHSNAKHTVDGDTVERMRNDPCNRDNWSPNQQSC